MKIQWKVMINRIFGYYFCFLNLFLNAYFLVRIYMNCLHASNFVDFLIFLKKKISRNKNRDELYEVRDYTSFFTKTSLLKYKILKNVCIQFH